MKIEYKPWLCWGWCDPLYLLIPFVGYIKDFQVYDPHRVGRITVELLGRIKDCKALTYRHDIKAKEIEEYRVRTLPTGQVITPAFELVFNFYMPTWFAWLNVLVLSNSSFAWSWVYFSWNFRNTFMHCCSFKSMCPMFK